MPSLASHLPRNSYRTPCADKNDSLGWTAGASVIIDGVKVGVRCSDAAMLDDLLALLPEWRQPSSDIDVEILLSFLYGKPNKRSGSRNYHLVYQAWFREARTLDLDEALRTFSKSVYPELAKRCTEVLFLTARAVDTEAGTILLFGSEESTLAAATALGGRERERFGDLYVGFTADHKIRVKEGRGLSLLTPAMLVMLDDQALAEPSPLTVGQASIHCLAHTPIARIQPSVALERVCRLASLAPTFSAHLSNPEQAASLLAAAHAASATPRLRPDALWTRTLECSADRRTSEPNSSS